MYWSSHLKAPQSPCTTSGIKIHISMYPTYVGDPIFKAKQLTERHVYTSDNHAVIWRTGDIFLMTRPGIASQKVAGRFYVKP